MIQRVLDAICKDMESFLQRKRDQVPAEITGKVLLHELAQLSEEVNRKEGNIICTLINIEQERTNLNFHTVSSNKVNPPVNVNLYILFSAYFSNTDYLLALEYISSVIGFFQSKQVFNPNNTPELPQSVEKITAELVNLDMRELSNFWTAMGAKHLPSVIYKLRMIPITEEAVLDTVRPIISVGTDIDPSKPS